MGSDDLKGKKSLAAHPEQGKLAAHPEPARIAGPTDDDNVDVPAVTADVDETPRGVRYGAAIILGLAFGVGCYLWFGTDNSSLPDATTTAAVKMAPTADYFNQPGANAPIGTSEIAVPDPFNSPYEPSLETADEVIMTSNVATAANVDQAPKKAAATAATATGSAAASAEPVVYLFAYDSAEIPASDALDALAAQAAATGADVDIDAYTDPNGRSSYNDRLSARRADAVKQYLCTHGVDPGHIHTHACGATDAYSTDAQNRRAEISLR